MPVHISNQLPELITPDQAWSAEQAQSGEMRADMVLDETPTPKVRHLQNNVTLLFDPPLGNGVVPGKGDLYIAETCVVGGLGCGIRTIFHQF